jgi:poly(ADP-ribose) glycohydrolase ARH3
MVKQTGISYRQAAQQLFHGEGSLGNGAAMRIAPMGLFFHKDSELYAQVETSAIVTHSHPVGIDGAAVLARAIAEVVSLDPAEKLPLDTLFQKLVDFARTDIMREKMRLVQALVLEEKISPAEATIQLKLSVAAHESVPFAIYSFLRYPTSYADCLYCAILHGGDRDTMGAMAGAISGAYLGWEAIPSTWREKIENKTYLESLARKLVQGLSMGDKKL